MSDHSTQTLHILAEMRDLLRLIAEPAIAQRDKKLRQALREIGGIATSKRAKAILLMNGKRIQKAICQECGIDPGGLSNLVKQMKAAELLTGDPKQPELLIPIPSNFFAQGGESSDG